MKKKGCLQGEEVLLKKRGWLKEKRFVWRRRVDLKRRGLYEEGLTSREEVCMKKKGWLKEKSVYGKTQAWLKEKSFYEEEGLA